MNTRKKKNTWNGKRKTNEEKDKTKIVRKFERTTYDDSSSINKQRYLDMKKNIMNM